MSYRVGVDVGGTFTDFVGVDDEGRVVVNKVLTTPDDPKRAIIHGMQDMLAANRIATNSLRHILHGTTLVANSLIERKGAKTALVTTRGFRDVLELGHESRYDIYDLNLERPEPLVPRPLRFELDERILANGEIEKPIDRAEAEQLVDVIAALGVESVAIVFVNSYVNPSHERELAALFAERAPHIIASPSAAVAPEWREYERTSTTAANAFVRPLLQRYFTSLSQELRAMKVEGPLGIMMSHGGIMPPEVAAAQAIRLVESGPVGGVLAAAYFARRAGLKDVIAFDMGGTTAKVSVVKNGQPLVVTDFEVARAARFKRRSGLPLKISTVELIEVGAGGGSIGHKDRLGLLKVGPESAGSVPGPACYGRGGEEATVTDADLALGLLNHEYFLGGELSLYPDRALQALERLGSNLGISAESCARGIYDVVNRHMALAMRTHVVERGFDPGRFALIPTGGAGPVHAYEVARSLNIRTIVYPPLAGVASSLGFLTAPFGTELSRSLPASFGRVDWSKVRRLYAQMEQEAMLLLRSASPDICNAQFERRCDVRYAGQGYEVVIPVAEGELNEESEPALRARFDAAYFQRYGSRLESAAVEVLNYRLRAIAFAGSGDFNASFPSSPASGRRSRKAYFPEIGRFVDTPVYGRSDLAKGQPMNGPLLVEERQTTIVIGPSARAERDDNENVVVHLQSATS